MPIQTTMAPLKGAHVGRKRTRPKFKPTTLRRKICLRLHDLADAAGVSGDDIAEACGTSKANVSRWFSGQITPDVDHWPMIAKALRLASVRDLLPPS